MPKSKSKPKSKPVCVFCGRSGTGVQFVIFSPKFTPFGTACSDCEDKITSENYDTEAIQIDIRNNNFSAERLEEYRHENIVLASLTNGQFSQAKEQCAQFGLSYEMELAKFTVEG